MADLDTLYQALRNAHNAGDTAGATRLAQYIQTLGIATPVPTPPAATPASAPKPPEAGVLETVGANLAGGFGSQFLGAGAALADYTGASDTAKYLDEKRKSVEEFQQRHGGDTTTGRIAAGVGSMAPALLEVAAAPFTGGSSLVGLAANAGLFALPGFRDTYKNQIDSGASPTVAAEHALADAGLMMVGGKLIAKGGKALPEALQASEKLLSQMASAAGEGAAFTAANSAINKGIDVANNRDTDASWVDPRGMAESAASFGILRAGHHALTAPQRAAAAKARAAEDAKAAPPAPENPPTKPLAPRVIDVPPKDPAAPAAPATREELLQRIATLETQPNSKARNSARKRAREALAALDTQETAPIVEAAPTETPAAEAAPEAAAFVPETNEAISARLNEPNPSETTDANTQLPEVQQTTSPRRRKRGVAVPVQPTEVSGEGVGSTTPTGTPTEPSGQRLVPAEQPASAGVVPERPQPSALNEAPVDTTPVTPAAPAEPKATAPIEAKAAAPAEAPVTPAPEVKVEESKSEAPVEPKRTEEEVRSEYTQRANDEMAASPLGKAFAYLKTATFADKEALRKYINKLVREEVLFDGTDIRKFISKPETTVEQAKAELKALVDAEHNDSLTEKLENYAAKASNKEFRAQAEENFTKRDEEAAKRREVEAEQRRQEAKVEPGPEHAEAIEDLNAKVNLYNTSDELVKAQRAAAYIAGIAESPVAPEAVRQHAQRLVDAELDAKDIEAGRKKAGTEGLLYQYKSSNANEPSTLRAGEVHALATKLVNNWKNIPAGIMVHHGEDTLPQHIIDQAKKDGMTGKITGVYDTEADTVHLVEPNLKNSQDVLTTLVHEIVGHFGLRSVLGSSYNSVMDKLYAGNKAVRDAANNKMVGEHPLDKRTAVEEVLAEMAETGPEAPLERGALRRIYDAIKAWVRDTLGMPQSVSDDAVRQIVANARRYVTNGNIQGTTTPLANTGAVLYSAAAKKAAPAAAPKGPGTPGPTISERAKNLAPPPTGAKAAVAAATKYAKSALSAPTGIALVDKVRNNLVDKYAVVTQRLAQKYSEGIRDAAGKVNAVTVARQSEDLSRMLPMFFSEGGAQVNSLGLMETFKLKDKNGKEVSFDSVYNELLPAYAKAKGLDFETAYAEASTVLEGMRVADLVRGNANGQNDTLIHWRDSNNQIDTVRIAEAVQEYNAHPELQEMSHQMDTMRIDLIDKLEASGRLTAVDAKFYREAIHYVPFDRLNTFDEKFTSRKRLSGNGVAQMRDLPKFIGSEVRPVGNVFENYSKTMAWLLQSYAKQNAATELVAAMVDVGAAKKLQGGAPSKTGYEVPIFEQGVRTRYEVPSGYDQAAFVDAPRQIPAYVRGMAKSSKVLRLLVTANPAFALSQVIQDTQGALLTSGVKSPVGFTAAAFGNFAKLSWHEMKGLAADWSGKDFEAHPFESEFGRTGLAGDVDYSAPAPATEIMYRLGLRQRSAVGALVHRLERITQFSDLAVRKAVYDYTLKETKSGAYPLGDTLLADTRARELINFHRRGTSGAMQDLITTVPFLNATAQSMDILYRNFAGKDNTMGIEASAARKQFLTHLTIYGGAALAYALAKAGDDEYENLDRRTRDNNWILGGGVKIAIRGDIAAVKVAIENAVGYYRRQGTPEEQQASEMVLSTLQYAREQYIGRINVIPTAIRPVVENLFNYSTLTGRPLEGTYQQALLPHERTSKGTSELSKSIAEYLAQAGVEVSPIKIDNAVKGYFGTSAAAFLMMTDAILHPMAVDRPMSKWIGLSGLMYDTTNLTNSKDEFYDLRSKVMPIQKTLQDISKTDVNKAYAFAQEHVEELALSTSVMHTLQSLSDLRKYRNWLNGPDAERTLSKEDRTEQMNKILEMENQSTTWVRQAKLQVNQMLNQDA